ncbi:META domain-containing protein [Henriciella litoralis]|uniref:META domain-containing protein n=1 Tax=Henriciella litoralis TaxID=568102 RepID=UPI00146C1D27|nr:META domain-containing protein [Henriciella litoralis]
MFRPFLASLCVAGLASCVQPPEDMTSTSSPVAEMEMQMTTVSGSLSYRQRIALPQDAVATISVFPAGPADAALSPVDEQSFDLNGRQVPIPFEVTLREDASKGPFSLRAKVSTKGGELLWTTDTVMTFEADGAAQDFGLVELVPAGRARVDIADLTGKEWMVAMLDGAPVLSTSRVTVSFDADGRISGQASCNAYTGSYKVNKSALYVGPLALTRKACVGPLMEQERTFMALLESVSDMSLDDSGTLTIRGEDGKTLTMR